jgi:hypothetical protein
MPYQSVNGGASMTVLLKVKRIILVITALFFSLCLFVFPVSGSDDDSSELNDNKQLRFGADGKFVIVQFTDTQDDQHIHPKTVRLIEAVLDDQDPDLVVFTGDNITSGPKTEEDVWIAINNIVEPVDSRAIPWLITYGNHDEDHSGETGLYEADMLEIYMSYAYNINQEGPEGVNGTGNMHVLVYDSAFAQPLYNVWALDSGRYAPAEIDGQSIADDDLPGWDWIRPSQIEWYTKTSEKLEEEFGEKIPSLMYFHIPLWEFGFMWNNKENHDVVGEKNECVCSGPFNSGLYAAMLERGDVKGVFVGHDHINDYVGNYFGIHLGYSANTGFGTYGLSGAEKDRMRGARVFIIDEEDPENFETYMVRASDYGI